MNNKNVLKTITNNKDNSFELSKSNAISTQEKGSLKIFELEKLEWLTTEEAANYLKITIGTLRNWTSNGRITFYKLGRSNRYLLDDLVKFLLKNKRGDLTYGN